MAGVGLVGFVKVGEVAPSRTPRQRAVYLLR
jgi:hypothetical protein